jgi:hypothetical protein
VHPSAFHRWSAQPTSARSDAVTKTSTTL